MIQKEPNTIHIIFGLATLAWLALAWDAYMQMGLYGSVLALFAGVTFIFLAREAAPGEEVPWLFGWNDDSATHAFMRMPVYASIFIGPVTRHIAEAVAPDFFAQKKSYLAVMIASAVIGICMSLYINIHKREDAR